MLKKEVVEQGTHLQCPSCGPCMACGQRIRPTPSSHHGRGPMARPEMCPCKHQVAATQDTAATFTDASSAHLASLASSILLLNITVSNRLSMPACALTNSPKPIVQPQERLCVGISNVVKSRMSSRMQQISSQLTSIPPRYCHHKTARPSLHACRLRQPPSHIACGTSATCPPHCHHTERTVKNALQSIWLTLCSSCGHMSSFHGVKSGTVVMSAAARSMSGWCQFSETCWTAQSKMLTCCAGGCADWCGGRRCGRGRSASSCLPAPPQLSSAKTTAAAHPPPPPPLAP